MEVIRIGFVGSLAPAHVVIQTATFSPWAHCWALMDNGKILDATKRYGVKLREYQNYGYGAWREDYHLLSTTTRLQRQEFAGLLMAEIGKPYDSDWILGYPVNRNWQDDDKWSCSELLAAKAAKVGIIHHLKLHRVTPGRLLDELYDRPLR